MDGNSFSQPTFLAPLKELRAKNSNQCRTGVSDFSLSEENKNAQARIRGGGGGRQQQNSVLRSQLVKVPAAHFW